MTWFKVDDSFYDHPKVFDAPDCAVALWTRAGTWSARNLTDGFVPAGMPARLCDDHERAVRELVNRGLWSRSKGGFQFHDWHTYQPTREEAMSATAAMSSGGALGNHRRWHVGKARIDPSCRYCQGKQDRGTDRVPDQVGEGTPESPPNPPVPSRPEPKNKPSSPPPAADEKFDQFWAAYPRKVGKGQARKAWAKAIKAKVDPEAIIAGAERYARERSGQDHTYTAHPSTWLHGERWDDTPHYANRVASGEPSPWWEN